MSATTQSAPMVWFADPIGDDRLRCAVCDRPVREAAALWVHVIDNGATAVPPSATLDHGAAEGSMGCFPVGGDCARRHFRGIAESPTVGGAA